MNCTKQGAQREEDDYGWNDQVIFMEIVNFLWDEVEDAEDDCFKLA